jgi:hypothetical protein
VHPATAAATWCATGSPGWVPAAGDRVGIVGVPRLADRAVDRELDGDGDGDRDAGVRLVFAGSEADPLSITRLAG